MQTEPHFARRVQWTASPATQPSESFWRLLLYIQGFPILILAVVYEAFTPLLCPGQMERFFFMEAYAHIAAQ